MKATVLCNLVDAFIGEGQHLTGVFDTNLVEIVNDGNLHCVLENSAQMIFTHKHMCCNVIKFYIVAKVVVYIVDDFINIMITFDFYIFTFYGIYNMQ